MRWALLAAISLASAARAHDADVIYALVEQRGEALTETVTLTTSSLGLLAPVDADGDGALSAEDLTARADALRSGVWEDMPLSAGGVRCPLGATQARLREGFVELTATFNCPEGELRQDFRFLRVLPANYRVVLGSQVDGERGADGVAQGSFSTLPIPRPRPVGSWNSGDFQRGFDEGISRSLRADSLFCLAGVLLAFARWKRGLVALAFLLAGVIAGSFIALPFLVTALIVAFTLLATFARKDAPVALGLPLGAALAARFAGTSFAESMGLSAGFALAWLLVAPAFIAFGVLLARRTKRAVVVRVGVAICGIVLLGVTRS